MTDIQDTVEVAISYFTGQEEGDDGTPYYVASCDPLMFTTEADTFEELLKNIRECLSLALDDVDTVAEYGIAPNPRVKLVMELPENYAQTA